MRAMHIGLIIDGNRRWAKQKLLPKSLGHKKGVDNLEKILKICAKRKDVDIISVFTLSTENMQREPAELQNLFKLLEKFARKIDLFRKYGIKVRVLGDISVFPKSCITALEKLEQETQNEQNLLFCPALNYGGRAEIVRAINSLKEQNIDEESFRKHLDSGDLPDIDLLIRTGGKKRFSNFMLWSCAYTELYFLDKMWPDFSEDDLNTALKYFTETQRNFGK